MTIHTLPKGSYEQERRGSMRQKSGVLLTSTNQAKIYRLARRCLASAFAPFTSGTLRPIPSEEAGRGASDIKRGCKYLVVPAKRRASRDP
jgi:hypothetical protein